MLSVCVDQMENILRCVSVTERENIFKLSDSDSSDSEQRCKRDGIGQMNMAGSRKL